MKRPMLMLMKRQYLQQIAAGRKTATLRPWKTCRLRRGDGLVFSGGMRVTITRVVRCHANTLHDDDVRALGFASRAAVVRAWRALYPGKAADAPCVVLHFKMKT